MNKTENPLKKVWKIKFGRRMFLIYLIGGLLPMILIGFYLIYGTSQILIKQAENTEIVELETIKRQILEVQNTMTTMSQYFYFDEKLEEIAQKDYQEYQEMIEDYKNYTAFLEYRKYYNDVISRISVFMENDTLKGNSEFVVVDDKIRQQDWYQRVSTKGNGVVWAYLPHVIYGYDHALALTRMVKTKKNEDVGVLVIYIRPERFEGFLSERVATSFISLNGETVICQKGEEVTYEQIKGFLPELKVNEWQDRVTIEGKEYVLTCKNVKQDDTNDYLQVVSVRALDEILQGVSNQNKQSILLMAMSVLAAFIIISISTLTFAKRVERFRAQMQKAAAGNFELEEKLGGNDEISQLYDYLSIMIWKIQQLLSEIYQEKLHAEQLKSSQKEAEFKMLTSQINPHFLYNTLETIRMKARVNKQYEIEELVKMLAKILRNNIRAGEKDVTLKAEMELVEYYLRIQQYRFGEKVQYQIIVPQALEDYQILPLILQPLVENAIIHGLENKEGNGCIVILVRETEQEVVISVEDDGIGISEEKLEEIQKELHKSRLRGEHIGICNVHQRVQLKYGSAYGVTIESSLGEKTKVEVHLPRK